jgi:hypothetical protein
MHPSGLVIPTEAGANATASGGTCFCSFPPKGKRMHLPSPVIPTEAGANATLLRCHSDRSRRECDGEWRNLLLFIPPEGQANASP